MYEVNVRQYSEEGTFDAFEPHLERLKEMGVGILWFMPIHPIGEENRLGTLGSYYSVKDYYGINPEFGTFEEFKELVSKAQDMGFYVIIDWVANHTAWDNPLKISHYEWYTKDSEGNFMPPAGTNWSDVIDLDYSKEGLRNYMIDAMKYWITEANVDGFRCDAAGMVPMDFWESAITELKEVKPEILMLAEGDGVHFEEAGFDMSFAWGLYGFGGGVLTQIIEGVFNANFLASTVRQELSNYSDEHYRLYFTSNHDENSWHGTVFERFDEAAELFSVVTQTINGMPLIYSGQEAGLNKRLKFFEKDLIDWQPHPFSDVYKTLLELKKENKALWNGSYGGTTERILTNNNPDIYAFIRAKDDDKVFIIFNLTDSAQTVVPVDDIYQGQYVNVFSNDTLYFTNESEIELYAWDYKVFKQNLEITTVENYDALTTEYSLKQNYPNPFNPSTTIQFDIPTESKVTIKIYDILGSEIYTLVDEILKPGNYKEIWYGKDSLNYSVASGVYFVKIQAQDFMKVKKMLLLR